MSEERVVKIMSSGKEEEARFSINGLVKQLGSPKEKNTKTAQSTKRASNKAAKNKGKYMVKYDKDGVKHMILK